LPSNNRFVHGDEIVAPSPQKRKDLSSKSDGEYWAKNYLSGPEPCYAPTYHRLDGQADAQKVLSL